MDEAIKIARKQIAYKIMNRLIPNNRKSAEKINPIKNAAGKK